MQKTKNAILIGLLTIIPVWITWLVLKLVWELVVNAGEPLVLGGARFMQPYIPSIVNWLSLPLIKNTISLIVVLVILYVIGRLAMNIIGQRIIRRADHLIDKIPLIKMVYSGSKKLIEAFQRKSEGAKRVVLVNYPSPEMKTIGLVTRTLTDRHTGKQLVAVYVPTTPVPTAGFLEILPVEDVIPTDWSVNDAISFIVSGGAVGPDQLDYFRQQDADEQRNTQNDGTR